MGKYHPHGDTSIYDAMVRMAQEFALRYRWSTGTATSARSTATPRRPSATPRPAWRRWRPSCSTRSSRGRSTSAPTTTARTEEPIVLPAQIPQLLVNGSTGIAVGMATNIPPHNLGEVVRRDGRADRRPRAADQGPAQAHQGPDFPTGGQITNSKKELREIYETGQGRVRVRGEWKTESGRPQRRSHHHHLDPLRAEQVDAGREDRRGHHRQEAAAAGRRARRVDRRRAHRARAEAGRRSEAGDGVPLQAHAARDELPRQPDLPGPDREPGDRGPAAASISRRSCATSSTSARRSSRRRFEFELAELKRADPHPRGLREDLRRARRDDPDHPQVRRQGRRGREADQALRARRRCRPTPSSS